MSLTKKVAYLIVAMLLAGHISPIEAHNQKESPAGTEPKGSLSSVRITHPKPTPRDYWVPLDKWLKKQGSPLSGKDFYEVGRKYGIDPDLLIGIAKAETNLAKVRQRGSAYNIGSVCSYDSTNTTCATRSYRHGIEQIAQTLRNPMLRSHVSVSQLSGYGNPHGPYYASSPINWHRNVVGTMNQLKGKNRSNYAIYK